MHSSGLTKPSACSRLKTVSGVPLDILQGIDHVRDILVDNTLRFARGLPANNALLWGARGMGKSSLVERPRILTPMPAKPMHWRWWKFTSRRHR